MRKNKQIALGGMLTAVAMVVMCLGGLIPVATYVCPIFCCLIGQIVLRFCGRKIAWAWYLAVSLLSILLGPDKEAGFIFIVLGYYPVIKPWFDKKPLTVLLKLIFFNCAVLVSYAVMIFLLGMESILLGTEGFGIIGLVVMLLLGNATFLLLDRGLLLLSK